MALHDFKPRFHTSRNNVTWEITDIRVKRRIHDGAFTIEARGEDGKPGVFATAADVDRAMLKLRQILTVTDSDVA